MLASIQQQIVQVQVLCGFDAAQPNPVAPRSQDRAPAETEYLSDAEEKALEDEIEAARESGAKEAELIANAWRRQQAEYDGVGAAF